MSKKRTYFVSYSHKIGFGQVEILVKGKLVIDQLRQTIANGNGLNPEDIVIISFVELNPEKEVWSEDERKDI